MLHAIERGTLGQGSVAEGEYLRNMSQARQLVGAEVRWVEVCYCPTPLEEERPYWEEFFELDKVQDGASATISTALSRGHAAIAIAHSGLKISFKGLEARLCRA